LIIIQIPIILALFFIFSRSGLPVINSEVLYSFIPTPEAVQMTIAGLDLAQKSVLFAFFAAVTQFLYMKRIVATTLTSKNKDDSKSLEKNKDSQRKQEDFMEDITKAMNTQMLYVLPVIIFFAGYSFSAVVALYWTVSNIYTYLQDVYIKRNIEIDEKDITKGDKIIDVKVS
jgi:membrane protein insertase Oxa1/YidC/SpoIIIJ